jgi:DNA-binding CsgD family transcriptional regulator
MTAVQQPDTKEKAGVTPTGDALLVGRERELAVLHGVVTSAMVECPRLVEVVADPGLGTTRLLDEVAELARRQGRVVLSGRASAARLDTPFAVVVDTMLDALLSLCSWASDTTTVAHFAMLRRWLSGLMQGTPATPPAAVERRQLFRAVRALLEVAGWGVGVVFVLDDAHWTDLGSVVFIDYLMRHPPAVPFTLVIGYRPRQVPPQLSRALAQFAATQHTRLELRPLTEAEVVRLVGSEQCPRWQKRLYDASGGIPLYVEYLRRHEDLVVPMATGLAEQVFKPEVLATVPGPILAEVAVLSPTVREVASAAAFPGECFDAEIVAEIAGLSKAETTIGLDDLVARDLIRPADRSRLFRFRHPLVRVAAYHLADAGRRLDAHARAARALSRRGADVVSQAPHVARSAQAGDLSAVRLLVNAAESVVGKSPDQATEWLAAAGELLALASQRLTEFGLARPTARNASGRFARRHELIRGFRAGVGDQPDRMGDQPDGMGDQPDRVGDQPERPRVETAARFDSTERGPDPRDAAQLALDAVTRGGFDEARRLAQRAIVTTTTGSTLDANAATMLAVHAIADAHAGLPVSAVRYLRPAVELLDSLPDEPAARQLSVFLQVGRAEVALERFDDALRHAARGVALATRTGQHHLAVEMSLVLAHAQTWLGLLSEAAASLRGIEDTASRIDRHTMLPLVHACQAAVTLWLGEPQDALRLARNAVTGPGPTDFWWNGFPQVVLGAALLGVGDSSGCVHEIVTAGGDDLAGYPVRWHAPLCDVLVWAETKLGNHGEAERWLERARRSASFAGLPGVGGLVRLSAARIAHATGDEATAVAEVERAVSAFASVCWRGYEARARHLFGNALSALGRHRQAQQEYGRAKELFAGCGAARMRALVLNEERRLGARMPRRRRSGKTVADSLSPREREIADLVRGGLTNRQIAHRLFLSPKTVEAHLSHIFAKLGVASRTALASLHVEGLGTGGSGLNPDPS